MGTTQLMCTLIDSPVRPTHGGNISSRIENPLSRRISGSVLREKSQLTIPRCTKNDALRKSFGKRRLEAIVPRNNLNGRTFKINSCSSYNVGPHGTGDSLVRANGSLLSNIKEGVRALIGNPYKRATFSSVEAELIVLSIPAMVGQAIEPMSQLLETAYIGRLGPVELASVGVSVSIFNIISKLFNIPLLSVTTSLVAADIARTSKLESTEDLAREKIQLPSVSTAILLAAGIGIIEAFALYVGAGSTLNMMGVPLDSPMRGPSQRFLALRALGAPAVVVCLAIQGVFRGFKDTKTPLLCTGLGNLAAVVLFPIFMHWLKLGINGAAMSVLSHSMLLRPLASYVFITFRYIITILLAWFLSKKVILLPPKLQDLEFDVYMKSGGLLLGRTLAVLITMTLGTAMAARQGPVAMAAHQICLQIWLAMSLLTDALSLSGQAMIAGAFPKREYKKVKDIAYCVLKTALIAGISLAVMLCPSFGSIAQLFTKDAEVLEIARSGALFVGASQPINALAFVFDGLHYGVSDFSYAALSMMTVGAISSAILLYVPTVYGLYGVWWGLSLFMGLRMVSGFLRLLSKTGPWWFLWSDFRKGETETSSTSNLLS